MGVKFISFLAVTLFFYSMAANSAVIVRQPEEFKYGECFDLFFRRFCMYAKNVKCDPTAQYDLLLSYLDKKSFRLADGIAYTARETTTINTDIKAALPKLKKALTPSDKIPAKVELKFRKQGQTETLSDFGFAIQSLGASAFGTYAVNNGQVIDAFCMGVKNAELSAKLLSTEVTTLSGAINFAQEKESAMAILQFVARNRASAGDKSYDGNVSLVQAEETGPPEIVALTQSQTDGRTQPPGSSRVRYEYMRPSELQALNEHFCQWPGNRRM